MVMAAHDDRNGRGVRLERPSQPGDEQWPAGLDETREYAQRLLDAVTGLPFTPHIVAQQRRMAQGYDPSPHPAELLVSSGLAVNEQGFIYATAALRTAAAMFDVSGSEHAERAAPPMPTREPVIVPNESRPYPPEGA